MLRSWRILSRLVNNIFYNIFRTTTILLESIIRLGEMVSLNHVIIRPMAHLKICSFPLNFPIFSFYPIYKVWAPEPTRYFVKIDFVHVIMFLFVRYFLQDNALKVNTLLLTPRFKSHLEFFTQVFFSNRALIQVKPYLFFCKIKITVTAEPDMDDFLSTVVAICPFQPLPVYINICNHQYQRIKD